MGYLYGTFNEDSTVKVECIYEPPQETTDTSFQILSDSKEVNAVLFMQCPDLRELLPYTLHNDFSN